MMISASHTLMNTEEIPANKVMNTVMRDKLVGVFSRYRGEGGSSVTL